MCSLLITPQGCFQVGEAASHNTRKPSEKHFTPRYSQLLFDLQGQSSFPNVCTEKSPTCTRVFGKLILFRGGAMCMFISLLQVTCPRLRSSLGLKAFALLVLQTRCWSSWCLISASVCHLTGNGTGNVFKEDCWSDSYFPWLERLLTGTLGSLLDLTSFN